MAVIDKYAFIEDIYLFLPRDIGLDTEDLITILDKVITNIVKEDDDSRYCDVLYAFLNMVVDISTSKEEVDYGGLVSDSVDLRREQYGPNRTSRWERFRKSSVPHIMKLQGCEIPETFKQTISGIDIHTSKKPTPLCRR